MSTVKHNPTSGTMKFGNSVQFPAGYISSKKYPTWLVCHGLGEINDGSLAGITHTYEHPLFEYLRAKADQYGIILVFVNTDSHFYSRGEIPWNLDWAEANLPTDKNQNGLIAHSLGFYGSSHYALTDPAFCARLAVIFPSSSGPYPDNSPIFKNMVDANNRVWAICSLQDAGDPATGDSGTNFHHTAKIYTEMKALRSDAKVMLTTIPAGTFKDSATQKAGNIAHNAAIGRLTDGLVYLNAAITQGIPADLPLKMDIYQWALSNPRGSAYRPPTESFASVTSPVSSPVQAPPITPSNPKTIRSMIFGPDGISASIVTTIQYTDGSAEVIRAAKGDRNMGASVSLQYKSVVLDFVKNPNRIITW
jgi:hypothetical protein